MIYQIHITNQAEEDLRKIYEYIAFSLLSPENATSQLDRLEDQIFRLNEMPARYKLYPFEPWKSIGIRVMPVDNYVVLYLCTPRIVHILRVFWGKQNLGNQLNKSSLTFLDKL